MDFCQIPKERQSELFPLLGKCFACWAKYGREDVFPFEMTSFAAVENGVFAAHCGMVEFSISDGAGGRVALGGIANVCTDPDFRHRGLAETLCRMAIDAAKKKNLAGLPLFTSFEKVYAKNNWWNYPVFMPKRAVWKDPGTPQPLKKGDAWSAPQRKEIISLYENGFDFPGKVFRGDEKSLSLFSWRHHFGRFEFAFDGAHYAAGGGNLVCELGGNPRNAEKFLLSLPRENGETVFVLPENSPFWGVIGELAELEKADIFFHGPMVLDLDDRNFFSRNRDCYFPLTDRF